eukprot:TRINITY_DN16515_c0_g1_i1.p1 TRINITY_DN16515_c0_g1~~TRINITY_DN16515_c0_g1_i1.p1  ORF type:complete len:283 (+),score=53.17 TRINITY_DN16515_c0_g1_i1:142-990(+)
MIPKQGDTFPSFVLKDHKKSDFSSEDHLFGCSEYMKRMGFEDPPIVILYFFRGHFCPRDQAHLRSMTEFHAKTLSHLPVELVAISTSAPIINDAFRAGLGATFQFLSDETGEFVRSVGLEDATEGEYAGVSRPYVFVCRGVSSPQKRSLIVHNTYDGWWLCGRPTEDELLRDIRGIMKLRKDASYDAWNDPHVKKIRVPQQVWQNEADLNTPPRRTTSGHVTHFDVTRGVGDITEDVTGQVIFFHFTSIPGEGYRTLDVGDTVSFEIMETKTGATAYNINRF